MSALDRVVTAGCEEARARLSEHLEGDLSGWRRLRVVRHLTRCDGCQAVLRSLATVVEHLQTLGRESPPPPASAVDAVIGRIRRGAADEPT